MYFNSKRSSFDIYYLIINELNTYVSSNLWKYCTSTSHVIFLETQSLFFGFVLKLTAFGNYLLVYKGMQSSTWFPNPTPAPRQSLPMMSMAKFTAATLKITPMKKNKEASCMVLFLPIFLHAFDAKKQATVAER